MHLFCLVGYVFKSTSTITSVTTTLSKDATPTLGLNLALPIILGSSIAGAIIVTFLVCFCCKKRVTRKFCPVDNETLTTAIQETEMTVFRYENELNEKTEELEALTANKQDDQVGEADNRPSITNNPGDSHPLLYNTSPNNVNSMQSIADGVSASGIGHRNGETTINDEHENQASFRRVSCIEMNEIIRNEGPIPQTVTDITTAASASDVCGLDSDAASSDDDITVKDESSDEESGNELMVGNKKPKRVVRVVTEIEI